MPTTSTFNLGKANQQILNTQSSLAVYISGDVAPSPDGIVANKFYFWNGKVRYPTTAISAGETLTDSNMPVVSEGGLNILNQKMTEHGNYALLLESKNNDTAVALSNSINNYQYLLVLLIDNSLGASHGSAIIPSQLFKTRFTSKNSAFGITVYNNNRYYCYANYVSDTSVYLQVATGYKIAIYGIK